MIKLRIENYLEDRENYDYNGVEKFNDWDREKWRNGKIYEFNTLKEIKDFCDSCDIDFTEEYAKNFGSWEWEEINTEYDIDPNDDNMMIFAIMWSIEFRD